MNNWISFSLTKCKSADKDMLSASNFSDLSQTSTTGMLRIPSLDWVKQAKNFVYTVSQWIILKLSPEYLILSKTAFAAHKCRFSIAT